MLSIYLVYNLEPWLQMHVVIKPIYSDKTKQL